MTRAGLPHSEILGSKVVCTSPRLIAAYHVLHRLPVPRHPPYALGNLTEILGWFDRRYSAYFFASSMKLSKNGSSSTGLTTGNIRRSDTLLRDEYMEMTGIEPATYGLQSHRSPN